MNDNINQEEIYFSDDDIFFKISEILKKNKIEESPEEAAFKEDESFIHIVLRLTKDFINKKIKEKDFADSLQKQLNVSSKVAKNIAQDTKEKILPLAERIKTTEETLEEKPITAIPTRLIDETQNITEKPTAEEPAIPTEEKFIGRRARTAKNIIKPPEVVKKEIPSLSKKLDSYRESIE